MMSANPGPAQPGMPGSRPIASVSLDALAHNARHALEVLPPAGAADTRPVADLRADAWGHGAEAVARVLAATGVREVLVDPAARNEVAAAVPGIRVAPAADPLGRMLDMATVYGLPGPASPASPALRLRGRVLSVKSLRAGEGVSYGFLHRAAADTRIALVTGGYAQGVVRSLGGRVSVSIGGTPHPIVGRVAMDVCVVDIEDAAVLRGDEVELLGPAAPLSAWVAATGLGAQELVTAVGLRAVREHVA